MLLKGNTVLENIDERNLTRELEIAKFRNYGREKFSELVRYNISFEEFLRNSGQFFSINLPKEISEYFLRFDTAPYFIISDSPLLKTIEKMLLSKKNDYNFVSNYREIKNYYQKWAQKNNPKEKNYFANSIINGVERNFAFQSFFNVMVYGIILTYDKIAYNPKKAIELFTRAEEVVQNCDIKSELKNEVLYFINIYKGFVYLKEYEYLHSLETFEKALKYNPNGVTGFFYSALCARYIDDFDLSFDFLHKIIEFDKLRFKYAINYNHLSLFNLFYQNAVFYQVFTENGFAQLLPDIDFLIRSYYSDEESSMDTTYSKVINLNNLRIKEFFDDSVIAEIKFLKNTLTHYNYKKIGLIRIVEQIFRDKLVVLLKYIITLIESYYYEQIKEEMVVYDNQIEQNKRHLTRLKHELEDARNKIRRNLEEAIKSIEENLTEKSILLEERIKSIDKNPKYNPSQTLYSSMIFTIFVALIIILVVGLITSLIGFGNQAPSLGFALRTCLIWGGITFIVGIFISIFTSFSTFWEKSSEKKELVEKLNKVKLFEEEEHQYIKGDSERKANVYENKFKNRIKAQEKIINDFLEERQHNYKLKFETARKEIENYTLPIKKLLASLDPDGEY